jgi:hypothetical protein
MRILHFFLLMLFCFSSGLLTATAASSGKPSTNQYSNVVSALKTLRETEQAPSIEARRIALETANAFTNEGFRVRDGEWSPWISKNAPVFLQVTLFAGNRYWFVAATSVPGTKLRVSVYSAAGKPIKGEQWQDPQGKDCSRSAAGVAPEQSGEYIVGVEMLDAPGTSPVGSCLVYAYQ